MPNTSLNTSDVLIITNKSGGTLAYGDVVVPSAAADRAVTVTTDPGYAGLVGVVIELGGISDDSRGAVALKGYVPKINLLNTAARLDELTTSASNGKGQSNPGAFNSFGIALTSASSPEAYLYGPSSREIGGDWSQVGGRLTLTTATPVTTSDVTGAATLYLTPYLHGRIGLYYGGGWIVTTTDEVSVSLAAMTSGKNYDVFAYYTGSAVALEILVWTGDTARATALTRQDGVLVKDGDATRRYLGTIRASGAGVCEDSQAKRFVWNLYNQIRRTLFKQETAASWSYATSAWRSVNANDANRVEIVTGQLGCQMSIVSAGLNGGSGGNGTGVAIGEDSTTAPMSNQLGQYGQFNAGSITNSYYSQVECYPPLGYHYYQWLEFGNTGAVFYGAYAPVGAPVIQTGLQGNILA